jgi:glycerophosphoryl diester phosphodiesterase
VDELEDMRRMYDYGVDAITTDYPDRVRAVLGE